MTAASITTPRHPRSPELNGTPEEKLGDAYVPETGVTLEVKTAVREELGDLEYKVTTPTPDAPSEVVSVDPDQGIVDAIVSVTGIKDEVDDVIHPGSYAETLTKRKPKVILHHDWKLPVARVESIQELRPGDPGLPATTKDGKPWPKDAGALRTSMRFNLASTQGKEAFEAVRFYSETGECEWSIGYQVPKGKASRSKDGVRQIKAIDLYEISFVLFGAAPLTGTLGVKSGSTETVEEEAPAEETPEVAVDEEELAAATDEAAAVVEVEAEGAAPEEGQEEEGQDAAEEDTETTEAFAAGGDVPAEDAEPDTDDAASDEGSADAKALAAQPVFDVDIKRALSPDKRRQLASRGHALPDGSYPIENVSDLTNAISAFGRAKPADRAKVKAHIMKRARSLGRPDLIPSGWASSGGKKDAGVGHESLDRSPKKNWVELAGQLPAYIQHIAKDIHEQQGVPLSVAIPTAIAAVKRWASGVGNVKADTRAKAAAAVAEWEALKAKSHARSAAQRAAKATDTQALAKAYDPTLETGPDAGHRSPDVIVESTLYPRLPGTYEELKDRLHAAIRGRVPLGGGAPYLSIDGTWADRAVVTWFPPGADAKSYEVPYREEDGRLWLGEPSEVKLSAASRVEDEPIAQTAMIEEAADGLRTTLMHEGKAGRVLSQVNANKLRGAVEQLIAVLDAAGIKILQDAESQDGGVNADDDVVTIPDSTAPSAQLDPIPKKDLLDPDLRVRALRVFASARE
jgi:HK97 family phage prohead protease